MGIKISRKLNWLVVIIVTLFLLYFTGLSALFTVPINNFLNSIAMPIPIHCNTDDDCKMASIDCSICGYGSKGAAVNKDYKRFCPLPPPIAVVCPAMEPSWSTHSKAVCKNNQCVEERIVKEWK